MEVVFEVEYRGRDKLILWKAPDGRHFLKANGCQLLKSTLNDCHAQLGNDLTKWVMNEPKNHAEFLVKKMIFLIQGKANPYPHAELCHCRSVPTQVVEDAIFNGASDIETIRRQTSASTSCGTCAPDVESLFTHWGVKTGSRS